MSLVSTQVYTMCVLIRTQHVKVCRSEAGLRTAVIELRQCLDSLRTAEEWKRFRSVRAPDADKVGGYITDFARE